MIYTSGTTGTPKGVMLTHRGILYIASISGGMRHLSEGQRVYGVLPMSHVFGLSSVCMGSLYNGACLYTVPRFDAVQLLATLKEERITVLQGVPAMYARAPEYLKREQRAKAPALLYSAGACRWIAIPKNAGSCVWPNAAQWLRSRQSARRLVKPVLNTATRAAPYVCCRCGVSVRALGSSKRRKGRR